MNIPLKTIDLFAQKFEDNLAKYSYQKYERIDQETHDPLTVYLINDSLVLLVQKVGHTGQLYSNEGELYRDYLNNPYLESPKAKKRYYSLRIEELTHNDIQFKFDLHKFVVGLEELTGITNLDLSITYDKYNNHRSEFWAFQSEESEIVAEKRIDKLIPQLKIQERCRQWSGDHYYFIVLELEDKFGKIHRAVAHTTQFPHSYIINICKEWIRTGRLKSVATGTGPVEEDIKEAFNSWKGTKRQERLEKHLKYFFIERDFTSKDDAWAYQASLLLDVNNGSYSDKIRDTYLRPTNRWISEEKVYRITKKYYKDHAVIYQYRPYFLKSSAHGQMSYDIFISKLNIAIEYQGKQHFEPVEYFGGEESFKKGQLRDKEKASLSKKNGVKLVYINYWEEITPELIVKRVGIKPDI